jgi:hypothetical protein
VDTARTTSRPQGVPTTDHGARYFALVDRFLEEVSDE